MKQSDIRGFLATYHRNGICGIGFYLCSFTFRDGKEWIELRATVFPDKGTVAVFSDNCVQRWRGDDFEPALREAIELQNKNQPMRAHVQGILAS